MDGGLAGYAAKPPTAQRSYLTTSHFIVTRLHLPPAFSQSAFVFELEGLADGEVPRSDGLLEGAEPVDEPPAVESLPVAPGAPTPGLLDVPAPVDGLLVPAAPPLPDVSLPAGAPVPAAPLAPLEPLEPAGPVPPDPAAPLAA
jgi:hypothetical protein